MRYRKEAHRSAGQADLVPTRTRVLVADGDAEYLGLEISGHEAYEAADKAGYATAARVIKRGRGDDQHLHGHLGSRILRIRQPPRGTGPRLGVSVLTGHESIGECSDV